MMYLYQFFRYLRDLKEDDSGQGTTEYAILVGVLVVIAIVAIIAFKGKISELWEAITSGINSL
ncbi:MAG: class III signal peptide-containing protein [Atopobium sp.]|nr:class III signal peptide-containing protein [Atopobium sp.]